MKITKTEHFDIQRKIVADTTSESWHEIPHVSFMYEPDATELYNEYNTLRKESRVKFSFNTLMLKVIAEGLKAAPIMNSHISFDRHLVRGKIDTLEDINFTMPMILPNGKMMTINLHNFENKSLTEMQNYIDDIKRRVNNTDFNEAMFSVSLNDTLTGLKQGHLVKNFCRLIGSKTGKYRLITLKGKEKKEYESISPKDRITAYDLEQGSVMVSNIGSTYLGQRGGTALLDIVPPQVCAFAVGAIQKKPLVIADKNGEDKIEARLVLPLCIAFDHRALDFGDTAPLLKKLDEIFDNPKIIRSWVGEDNTLKNTANNNVDGTLKKAN